MYQVLPIISGLVTFFLLSVLLLRVPKRKKITGSLESLFDTEGIRKEVDEKIKRGFLKQGADFLENQKDSFDWVFKILLINMSKLRKLLFQANYDKYNAEELAVIQIISTVTGIVGFLIMMFVSKDGFLAFLFLIGGLTARLLVESDINSKYKKRVKAFSKDFPDFLDAIRIPIQRGTMQPDIAFKRISREWSGVLGDEMSIVLKKSENYGGALYEPLAESARRMGMPIYQNFVYTFCTALQTGTNLELYIGSLCQETRKKLNDDVLELNRKKSSRIFFVILIFFILPSIGMFLAPTVFEILKSL